MHKAGPTVQSSRTRTWQDEADILLSLIDCLVLDREAVYASSEFTTGRRFYQLCRRYKVRTGEELKKRLGREYAAELLQPNKQEGIRFARRLREFGHAIVLTPNPFHADPAFKDQNWSQDEYLEFWETVIRRKCRAVYFNQGWECSNGCTFEYLIGFKAGLGDSLFDHEGKLLDLRRAREMIGAAIESLEKEGFRVAKLQKVYAELDSR